MKKLKSQNGAIAIIVLVSVLFLTMFLISSYMVISNKLKTQKEVIDQTRQIYENYDLAEMRGDNDKLKDLQEKHKRADGNRSTTYSMISGTYNEVRTRLNLLATDNQTISVKLESLKDSLDD